MSVYERDFYGWTQQQAALLKERDFARLDIDNLSEEIEAMGRSERRQLTHRLEILLVHLLKWHYQPALRGRSWQLTIGEQRRRIEKLLRDNPSLRPQLPALLAESYNDATFGAMRETGIPQENFPAACPYRLEDALGEGWLPA